MSKKWSGANGRASAAGNTTEWIDDGNWSFGMTEQEIILSYIEGELPEDVTVMEVPIRRDPAGGYKVMLSLEGTEAEHLGDTEVVNLKVWPAIRPDLVAGYAPASKRLVVGEWEDVERIRVENEAD